MVDDLIRIYQNKIYELEAKRDGVNGEITTLRELIRSLKRENNG